MKIAPCILLISLILKLSHLDAQHVQSQKDSLTQKMDWFADAKLGIFIHWGIYSVQGISESWSFFNNYISHSNYMKQLEGFGAENYDPDAWVELIKDSGAKYSVITTKHHDGVSLWDSKADSSITTLNNTPAKSDLLSPFVAALKKSGLHTGLYYSLPDWSHPYYDIKTRTQKRYDIHENEGRWLQFVQYYQQQLEELSTLYQPDLLWFDGDWEHTAEEWQSDRTLALLKKYNPNIIINSRLNHHGDYDTPEQGVPIESPENPYWELCYTMNDSWGYQPFDRHYKTPNMIIRTLVDCISMGGNLLLDIGPKANGSIPVEQVDILKELGRWTNKHQEAIYATRKGWDNLLPEAKTSFSKDGKTLYIYLEEKRDKLHINLLEKGPVAVRQIGTDNHVSFKFESHRLSVDLTNVAFDPAVTVLALDFEDHPVREKVAAADSVLDVQYVLKGKGHTDIIDQLVEKTALGDNIFNGKLSEDGELFDISGVNPLAEKWVRKHAEILHDAYKGIPVGHFKGQTALSKDRQTLYLFVKGAPTGPVAIKGLKNSIARIRIVGEGSMISHQVFNKLYWSSVPGIVYIDIPAERLDPDITVIAVLLDSPIELYREEVKAIESNL